jgi:hypothetical protein
MLLQNVRLSSPVVLISMLVAGTFGGSVGWWITRAGEQPPSDKNPPTAAPVVRKRDPVSLPEADREYLWMLEHHGNVLNKFGFRRIGEALATQNAAGLAEIFAPGFDAHLVIDAREIRAEGSAFSVYRQTRAGASERLLAADEFVTWLLGLRQPFSSPPNFEFGISNLAPVDRDQLDGDWQGTCKFRMWGSAGPAGPAETVLVLKFRTVRPEKETLQEPGWFRSCSVEQVGEARASGFLFREVARSRGLDPDLLHDNWKEDEKIEQTGGVYACDYNRDGCVDLLVTDLNPPGVALYQGSPQGGFRDVTRDVGLIGDSGNAAVGFSGKADDCIFADLDNDGWEDLIVVAGGLFRNIEGKRFVPMDQVSSLFSAITPPYQTRVPARTMIPADFDRDGLIDLYVVRAGLGRNSDVSWIDEEPASDSGNQLIHNLGNWQFEDVTRASGTAGGGRSVFTAVWLDANNDGWPDVYVIDEFGKGVLLVNQRNSTFREHLLVEGPADFGSMGVAAGDIDNDGNIDLYSANMYSKAGNRVISGIPPGIYDDDVMARLKRLVQGSRLYRNQGGLNFSEVGRAYQVYDVGWAWGPTFADLNNDGWLDLYACAGEMSRDRTKPDG